MLFLKQTLNMSVVGLFAHLPSPGSSATPCKKAQIKLKKFMINSMFIKTQFWDMYNSTLIRKCFPYLSGYSLDVMEKYERLFNAKRDYKTRYYFQMVKRSLVHLMRSDETYLAVQCYGNPYATPEQTEHFKSQLMEVYYQMDPSELWKESKTLVEFLDFIYNFNRNPDYFFDILFRN